MVCRIMSLRPHLSVRPQLNSRHSHYGRQTRLLTYLLNPPCSGSKCEEICAVAECFMVVAEEAEGKHDRTVNLHQTIGQKTKEYVIEY